MRKILILFFSIFLFSQCCFALDLKKLKTSYLSGDYKAAIEEGEKILAQEEYSSSFDELYYILGLCYMKGGDNLRAWDIFEIIIDEFPNSKFIELAKLGVADTYFLRGHYSKADSLYRQLLRDNPDTDLSSEIKYRLSHIQGKLGHDEIYYTVQVGSFSNMDNASSLSEELNKKGYFAYIEEALVDGKKAYRVRAGKSSNRQEIVDLKKRLAQEGYPTRIYP